jgi:hypothetical protein
MFRVYNQATKCRFLRNMSQNVRSFIILSKKKLKQLFFSTALELDVKQWGENESRQKLSRIFRTHFRIPRSFAVNVIQYSRNVKKIKQTIAGNIKDY